jgi:putative transposase
VAARQAQRFLTVHDQVGNLFHVPYPKTVSAADRRALRQQAFAIWRDIVQPGAIA